MSKRKTHEEFVEELKEKNQYFYNLELLSEYVNAKTKIKCKCKIHNYIWSVQPWSLLQGCGCPLCGKERIRVANSFTEHDFLKKMRKINNDIEIIGTYTKASNKIKCRCKICGNVWNPIACNILAGHGCKKCADNYTSLLKRKNINMIYKECADILKLIDIDFSNYKNENTKLSCVCRICNYKWETTYHNFKSGQGCPKCSIKRTKEKLSKTQKEFESQIDKINPNIRVLGTYINTHTKIKCQCKICNNIWDAIPSGLIKKNPTGCPTCRKSLLERTTTKYLKNNKIDFVPQQKFNDLKGIGGRKLSYDFYLPKFNVLIECQGIQHEKPIDFFGGTETFEIQKEHDKRKNEYAKKHNIKLLEIWYDEINNIEQILSEELNTISNN